MAIPSIAVNAGVLAGAHLQDLHTKINFFTGDQGALFTGSFVPPVSPPSHINWNLTAPLGPDIPGQFPTYGNYGGLNYTGGKIGGNDFSIPALDPLDNAFRTHDQKYADAESSNRRTVCNSCYGDCGSRSASLKSLKYAPRSSMRMAIYMLHL